MTKFKRILAMVCILALAAGFAEQPALAEDAEPSAVYVAQIGSTKYTTLQDAVDHAANSFSTITLLTDIRLTDTVSLSSETVAGFWLDMNGHNIAGNCTIFAFSGRMDIHLKNPKQTGGTITSTSQDESAVTISCPNDGGMGISDVSIISENSVGVECNSATIQICCGRIEGGTYGVSCDNGDFDFFGGTVSGGTAYFTSNSGCIPHVLWYEKTEISEDQKTATVTGAVATTVAGWTQYFPTLQDAVNYCPMYIHDEGGNVKFKATPHRKKCAENAVQW